MILLMKIALALAFACVAAQAVERWGVYEISLSGPAGGNPYTDVRLGAAFRYRNRTVEVDGFYDGGGVYKIRFMPDEVGTWSYVTKSSVAVLEGKAGSFEATAASG